MFLIINIMLGILFSLLCVFVYMCLCRRGKKYPHNIFKHFLLNPPFVLIEEKEKRKRVNEQKTDEIMERSVHSHPEFLKEEYDVIIVGSGISALVTGGILSRVGKKCLFLEGHDRFGGSCHTYEEKGFTFCPGVHWLACCEEPVFRFMVDICTEEEIAFEPVGDESKDFYSFGEKMFEFRGSLGIDQIFEQFIKSYPQEEEGLKKLFKITKSLTKCYEDFVGARSVPFPLNLLLTHILGYEKSFHKYGKMSVNEMLDQCGIRDKSLRSMFNAYHPTLSTHSEDDFIFPVLAVVLDIGFKKFSLKGGGGEFPRRILANLRNDSKAVHHAKVKRILFDDKAAAVVGVQLESGEKIYSKIVVSSIGIQNTQMILPKRIRSHKTSGLKKVLETCEYSGYYFLVHIGLDCKAEDVGIEHGMAKMYAKEDRNECYEKMKNHVKPPTFEGFEDCYYIASFLDINEEKKAEDNERSKLTLFTFCFPEWFEKFSETTTGKRGSEYEEWKETYCEKILSVYYERYPELENHVEYYDTSTNLTNRDFYFCPNGASFGLNPTYEKIDLVTGNKKVYNPSEGLYLVGQDITTVGVFAAVTSTFYALGDIMGRNLFLDLKMAEGGAKKYYGKKKKKKKI